MGSVPDFAAFAPRRGSPARRLAGRHTSEGGSDRPSARHRPLLRPVSGSSARSRAGRPRSVCAPSATVSGSRERNAADGLEPQQGQRMKLRGIGRIPHFLHQAGQGVDLHPPPSLDVDHRVAVTPGASGQRFMAETTGYAQLSEKLGVVHAGLDAAPPGFVNAHSGKLQVDKKWPG